MEMILKSNEKNSIYVLLNSRTFFNLASKCAEPLLLQLTVNTAKCSC